MTRLQINDALTSLQRQIAVSVDRLKYKTDISRDGEDVAAGGNAYADAARLHEKAYSLLDSDLSYQLFSYAEHGVDASYAAKSYVYAAEVNRPSTVLIDFMFANNREFDFKV